MTDAPSAAAAAPACPGCGCADDRFHFQSLHCGACGHDDLAAIAWDVKQADHENWDRRPFDTNAIRRLLAVAAHHRAETERLTVAVKDLHDRLGRAEAALRDVVDHYDRGSIVVERAGAANAMERARALAGPPGGGPTK